MTGGTTPAQAVLYDLVADLTESKDLAQAKPDLVAELNRQSIRLKLAGVADSVFMQPADRLQGEFLVRSGH